MTTTKHTDLYSYDPNIAAAAVFAVLFGTATLTMIIQCIIVLTKGKERRIWILVPFICGGILETLGYAIRIASARNKEEITPYILQTVFLLVAPALFAASIYMIFGRLVRLLDAGHHSVVKLNWLTKLFVFGDVGSFLLQAGGGGLMESNANLGKIVAIAGLVIQIVFFGAFMVVMSIFQYRIRKNPTFNSVNYRNQPSRLRNWHMIMVTLFVTSALVFVRSIVRCVEFGQGFNGYIMAHEVFLYVFDATMMTLVMALILLQDIGKYFYFISHEALRGDVVMEHHVVEEYAKY